MPDETPNPVQDVLDLRAQLHEAKTMLAPPSVKEQQAELAVRGARRILPKGFRLVDSSNLLAIGYFEANSDLDILDDPGRPERLGFMAGRLEVIFPPKKDGTSCARWAYRAVPAYIIMEMLEAESMGSVFSKAVKPNADSFEPVNLGTWPGEPPFRA